MNNLKREVKNIEQELDRLRDTEEGKELIPYMTKVDLLELKLETLIDAEPECYKNGRKQQREIQEALNVLMEMLNPEAATESDTEKQLLYLIGRMKRNNRHLADEINRKKRGKSYKLIAKQHLSFSKQLLNEILLWRTHGVLPEYAERKAEVHK